MGRIRWLNPESTPAKTVEVVCLTTLTLAIKVPAWLTKNLPGSNDKVKGFCTFWQKRLKRSLSFSPNSSIGVSISSFLYGTLNPLPKSINSKSLKWVAASNRISEACKNTSISSMSLPVCMCTPLIRILVRLTMRKICGTW